MTVEDRWAEVAGVRVHYLEAGEGELVLVLLHGGSGDSAALSWGSTARTLGRDYRVLAPDLPGFGQSQKPRLDYDLQYFTRFIDGFAEALQLGDFALGGFSLGGQIALNFSLEQPRRLKKLILVSCAGIDLAMHWPIAGRLMLKMPGLHGRLRSLAARRRETIRFGLRHMVHDPNIITDELLDEVAENVSSRGAGYAWRTYLKNEIDWMGFRHNLSNRLQEIQPPTLIVHGRQDRLIPLRAARKAQAKIPDSKLRVFEDCGHWPSREKAKEFQRLLLGFLRD